MKKEIFAEDNIILNASFDTKEEAIIAAGMILYDNGYVEKEYIDDMLEREKVVSTYIGNCLAIPHGIRNSDEKIFHSGISFIQVPGGVAFREGVANLVIGIAGKDDEHLEMLGKLACICSEMENVERLIKAESNAEIIEMLSGVAE
jgi:PTS system mannitol-specific IIA component